MYRMRRLLFLLGQNSGRNGGPVCGSFNYGGFRQRGPYGRRGRALCRVFRHVCQWLIEHGKMVWLQPCGATIDMAESRRGEAVYRVLYSYTDNSGNHVLSTPALCYNKAHELNHPDRELLFFIDPDNPELYYCDPEHDKHDTEKPKL